MSTASRIRSLLDSGTDLEMRNADRDGPALVTGWAKPATLLAFCNAWSGPTLPYTSVEIVVNVRKIEGAPAAPTVELIAVVATSPAALEMGEYMEFGRATVTSAPMTFSFAVDLGSIPMPNLQPGHSSLVAFGLAHVISGGGDEPKVFYDAYLSPR